MNSQNIFLYFFNIQFVDILKSNLQFVTVGLVAVAFAFDAEFFRWRVLIRQIYSLAAIYAKRR